MEFALTEEQLELQEMVREFVAKEITPYAAEMDRENHAREGLMEKAADMGLLNVVVPEEYGGMGLDSVTVAVIYEELGKGCAGVATSIAANSLASYPILLAGTEEQKKAHCDLLNEGKLAAFALTEPGAGSDAGAVSTSAVKDKEAGTYTLNGAKAFITNGGIADTYLVFANTRKTSGICQYPQNRRHPRLNRVYCTERHPGLYRWQKRRQNGHPPVQYLRTDSAGRCNP